jgi:hypothetical protein
MNSTLGIDICRNSLMILLFIQHPIGFSLTITALVYDCRIESIKLEGLKHLFRKVIVLNLRIAADILRSALSVLKVLVAGWICNICIELSHESNADSSISTERKTETNFQTFFYKCFFSEAFIKFLKGK